MIKLLYPVIALTSLFEGKIIIVIIIASYDSKLVNVLP